MRFFSDNAAPVHPAVMAALAAADRVDTAYDGDAWSKRLDAAFAELFETQVRVLWVPTGTAANCLALAAMCPPYGGVICHAHAHIQTDEGGAPEFYTHGAKLMLVDGPGAKLSPDAVKESDLAGETITAKLTRAPGNNAPIGGLKVVAKNGWFAARPSGTENIYKIYAESFTSESHLQAIVSEAQEMVNDALDSGVRQ